MTIFLKKFGVTLTSRQAGKEAYAAFQPSLQNVTKGEKIVLDFEGVITFSPSWGDEFITPLRKKYVSQIEMTNTSNPSVKATLEMLEEIRPASAI
ncbi:MAG TPA: DUF4325 domain-containing protein [Candidatus Paceibacterota bacterium]